MSVRVFAPNAAGGFDVHPVWRKSLDWLCRAALEAAGEGVTIRYKRNRLRLEGRVKWRTESINIKLSGARGRVDLQISVSDRGSVDVLGEADLPHLDLTRLERDRALDFWFPSELDALCLLVRLRGAA